jgi:hypothetical protein
MFEENEMIGQKFYDDSNKDHWVAAKILLNDQYECLSLTKKDRKIYDKQDILRLLSLSMF